MLKLREFGYIWRLEVLHFDLLRISLRFSQFFDLLNSSSLLLHIKFGEWALSFLLIVVDWRLPIINIDENGCKYDAKWEASNDGINEIDAI